MRNDPGFMDLRQWIELLEQEGELHADHRAEVDWDREIGASSRDACWRSKGPALLFENIKGYEMAAAASCSSAGSARARRLALALGFPKDARNREIVQHVMKKNRETIPPVRRRDRTGEGGHRQRRRDRPD